MALGEVVIADGTLTGPDVVIAQRIEQQARPGGVCILGSAYDTIPRRLEIGWTDLGGQEAKGFTDRVRIYALDPRRTEKVPPPEPRHSAGPIFSRRYMTGAVAVLILVAGVALAWLQSWKSDVAPADPTKIAFSLPDRPSIAVLPFSNISIDKEQEFFADGITEDITTDLSRISGLFVVARNASLTFKGKSVEVRRVAEDLGVRHVLEGSVRRSGDRIRVTAQLVDALKGNHLWAERYDREFEDAMKEVPIKFTKALAVRVRPPRLSSRRGSITDPSCHPSCGSSRAETWPPVIPVNPPMKPTRVFFQRPQTS